MHHGWSGAHEGCLVMEEKQDVPTLVPVAGGQGHSQKHKGSLGEEHASQVHLFDDYLRRSVFLLS